MKIEGRMIDATEAFIADGRRLREIDPATFARVHALIRAYIANHDREVESNEVWASRLMEISSDTPIGQA